MREVKPTQKPVPSSDVKDLFFNSGLLDIWATSLERKYIDRFGNCHLTAAGMEWIFNELVTKFKIEFEQALLAAGYAPAGTFQEGADVVSRNGTVLWKLPDGDGDYYRWDGDLPKQVPAGSTPQSTGGVGKGAWVSVGDASLRGALSGFITPEMRGGSGDGVTDDSASIDGLKNATLMLTKNYRISGVVTVENVLITGNGKIIGDGIIRGTIKQSSDLSLIYVKTNLVFDSERDKSSITSDVILDPLGLHNGSVSTISDALNIVKSLVAEGRKNDVTVLCRAGRIEIPKTKIGNEYIPSTGGFTLALDSDVIMSESELVANQNSEGRLIFKRYGGDNPVITPVMKFISSYGAIAYSNTHVTVKNKDSDISLEAYDHQLNCVNVSSNYDKFNGKLPRNRNLKIEHYSDSIYSLALSKEDTKGMQDEDVECVALRINQDYSSSWNNIIDLDSSGIIHFKSQSNNEIYFNGYEYVTGFSAPYWLRNAKYLLDKDTYAVDKQYWYIPKGLPGILIPEKYYGWLLDVPATSVTIDGISFAAFDIPKNDLQAIWSERFQNAGFINAENATALVMKNYTARNITGAFVKLPVTGFLSHNFNIEDIGCAAFITGYQKLSNNLHLHDFEISKTGKYSTSAMGVYAVGENISIHDARFSEGSFYAIGIDSDWLISNSSITTSGNVYSVHITNTGKRDGIISDLSSSADFGAINIYGKERPVSYHLSNIFISSVTGHQWARGVFLDGGTNGVTATDMFIAGIAGDYCIDARQVAGFTFNNHFYNVCCIGAVRLNSNDSGVSVITGVISSKNNIISNDSSTVSLATIGFEAGKAEDQTYLLPIHLYSNKSITNFSSKFARPSVNLNIKG